MLLVFKRSTCHARRVQIQFGSDLKNSFVFKEVIEGGTPCSLSVALNNAQIRKDALETDYRDLRDIAH